MQDGVAVALVASGKLHQEQCQDNLGWANSCTLESFRRKKDVGNNVSFTVSYVAGRGAKRVPMGRFLLQGLLQLSDTMTLSPRMLAVQEPP